MNPEAFQTALTLNRVVCYLGFVLWAGTLTFWSLVWPGGHRDRRLFGLALAGAGLLAAGTVAEPLIRLNLGGQAIVEFAPPLAGAALLVRLAVLVGSVFFLVDLVSAAVTGGRRIVAFVAVIVVVATMAIQPAADSHQGSLLVTLGAGGYLLATSAWLGGLLGLAAVLGRGGSARPTDGLLTRFAPVALLSLVVLMVTWVAPALTAASVADAQSGSRFGVVLLVKIVILGGLLVLATQARRLAVRSAFRRQYHHPAGAAAAVQTRGLTLVLGVELAVAFVVLTTTGLMMMVPTG